MSASAASLRTCSKCGAQMEAGYVFGHSIWWSTGSSLAGTIAWTPRQEGGYWREPDAKDLKQVGRIGLSFEKSPMFPAWRCSACRVVEFSYTETDGTPLR